MPLPTAGSGVRLPHTESRRGAIASVLHVQSVNTDPSIPGLLAWSGQHHRPGATVSLTDGAVLLEQTEIRQQHGARVRWDLLWILWRYDQGSFTELARGIPDCSGLELRAIARRALTTPTESAAAAADRIAALLSQQIRQIDPDTRGLVLQNLLSRVVGLLVHESPDQPLSSSVFQCQTPLPTVTN